MNGLDLAGVGLKLSRAQYHLKCLEDRVGIGIDRDADISSHFDPGDDGHVVFYEGPPVPSHWGVIVGDFIHNTRSALDHLIAALVIANGKDVERANGFPVCVTESRFKEDVIERSRGRGHSPLVGLTDDQSTIIQESQPYFGRTVDEARQTPICKLHAFWNTDKHRVVHAGTAYVAEGNLQIDVEPKRWMTITGITLHALPGTLLEPHTRLATVRLGVHQDAPTDIDVKMKFGLTSSVAFGTAKAKPSTNIGGLEKMLLAVVEVIRRFDPSFTIATWVN